MLKIFEEWERDVKAHEGIVRTYSIYLLTAHAVSLRILGRMLPQQLLVASPLR